MQNNDNQSLSNKDTTIIDVPNLNQQANPVTMPLPGSMKPKPASTRKFEIELYDVQDEDDNGNKKIKKVVTEQPMYVEFASKQELDSFMEDVKMSGQIAKIIREIPLPNNQVKQQPPQTNQIPENNNQNPVTSIAQPTNQTCQVPAPVETPVQKPKTKPKIVTIGDVQLKYDGDVVYQKQWIKLNSVESSNFRIVNDSNNKVFNMSGKHIEAKRWVRVEESSPDDDTCEYLLND